MNSKWGAELGQKMAPLTPGFEAGDMGGIWNSEYLAITRENLESSSSMGEYLCWMVNTSMSNLEQLHLSSSLLFASFPTISEVISFAKLLNIFHPQSTYLPALWVGSFLTKYFLDILQDILL